MENKQAKEYISNITKASAYYIFRNGPAKDLLKDKKLTDTDIKEMQEYLEGHLSYLYTILLDESNLKKFELVMSTMNKFYVNDQEEIELMDEGFENLYEQLFPKSNINIK